MSDFIITPPGKHQCTEQDCGQEAVWFVLHDDQWSGVSVCEDEEHQAWGILAAPEVAKNDPDPWSREKLLDYIVGFVYED